jgi:ABC-2 type transport system ATP-binding protein
VPEAADIDIGMQALTLRDLVRRRDAARVRALRDFAERFAHDDALRDEALLLGVAPPGEGTEAEPSRRELDARMLELVDRIVADNKRAGGGQRLSSRLRRAELVRERLLARSPTLPPAFVGSGLGKTYPDSGFRLEPFELTLRPAEITGVVGQNAQGKTTLLRIVAGELRADVGTLSYPGLGQSGPRIDWVQVKQQLAYVPQELPRWRGSLRDTLHFEAALRGVAPADIEREVRFVVERLDLGSYLGKRWDELSGGYKLRFCLARALVWKPRLLVLDEPLASLDVKAKDTLLQDVRDLAHSARHPMAVLMSSHELHGLERVCRQMVFLKEGHVLYIGAPDAVSVPDRSLQYVLATPAGAERLRQLLGMQGLIELRDDAGQFTLRTQPWLDATALLSQLLRANVPVLYFRDVSRSVRRLFD